MLIKGILAVFMLLCFCYGRKRGGGVYEWGGGGGHMREGTEGV